MWQQALISVGSSLLSSALGGKSKGGGGKEGDYQFFRPQTPQEIMRDIQAAGRKWQSRNYTRLSNVQKPARSTAKLQTAPFFSLWSCSSSFWR